MPAAGRKVFPQYYRPRPYQRELHKMWSEYRIGVAVFPRQSGKDLAACIEMQGKLLRTPKSTGVYVSLDTPMIRDILWEKTYLDPVAGGNIRALHDNIPPGYATWRETTMTGIFSNDSRMKLQGYFQSGHGKNGVGTSFQHYTITEHALFSKEDPIPLLLPIITNESEDKSLAVVSTPRGKRNNPLWKLIQAHKGDPRFKLITRTIDDLNEMMKREGLPPVRSEEQLERDRESYQRRFGNDRMFLQEYYCSFEELDASAVYGEAYGTLVKEGRVTTFNLDPGHPVYIAFDIGSSGKHSDATSWIAFQYINGKLFLYDAGEGHGRALPEYVDDLREKHYFTQIHQLILPWDAEQHSAAIRETAADMLRARFPNVAVLARSQKAFTLRSASMLTDEVTDIQATRMQLANTVIHSENCEWVLECIENYKYEFNMKRMEWSRTPVHDQYSHMMDALRYAVQAIHELNFFGKSLYTPGGSSGEPRTYTQNWKGVW